MREFIKIVEDAQSDVDASQLTNDAWVATYHYVYDGGKLHEINIKGRDGTCVFMRDVEKADPAFKKTCLAFVEPVNPMTRTASTHHVKPDAHGCDTFIVFPVKNPTKDAILGYLSGNQWMFNHELIHAIDNQRFKSPDTMSYPDPNDKDAYYNDPAELNAYFHNIAEPLLQRLTMYRSDGPDALELYDPLPTDFRAFLANRVKTLYHEPLRKFWSHLTEENRRRLISRLYALHQEYLNISN